MMYNDDLVGDRLAQRLRLRDIMKVLLPPGYSELPAYIPELVEFIKNLQLKGETMGFDWRKFIGILAGVGPILLAAVPGGAALAPLAPLILQAIGHAEQMRGASGPSKKQYVLKVVADAASGTNLIKPGTIDEGLVTEAAGHAIDAVITSLNAIQAAHAKLPDVPALIDLPGTILKGSS